MKLLGPIMAVALVAVTLFTAQGQSTVQTPKATAENILSEALKQAKKEKKNVFIKFSASWCGWCHKMDTVLATPEVAPLFDKSYISKLFIVNESPQNKNLETPGGVDLLKRLNGDGLGIPFWVILNPKGEVITDARIRAEGSDVPGDNSGCPATKEEIDYLVRAVKASSSLKPAELTAIARAFGKLRNIEY